MGVNLHPGMEVTEKMIQEGNPEAVILAAGGEKIVPDIPGIDLPHVADAWQILSGETAPKKHALVIGGGLIGMETADFLSQKGAQVTLVEVLKRSPVLKITSHGYMLHTRLREASCKLLFDTAVKRIEPSSVILLSQGTEEVLSPIDQVVIAVGLKASEGLKKFLESQGIRHFVVGDAVSPRRIIEATEEGAKAAWSL
jgi:pyruvate/2-oxoglutarate dehydrogenase complex dihydrolipoamide dehydrogenase (E3) component